jgi:hypothetical protein
MKGEFQSATKAAKMANMQTMTRSRIRKAISGPSCPSFETDHSDDTTSSVAQSCPLKKPKTPDPSVISNQKVIVDVEGWLLFFSIIQFSLLDLELLGKEKDGGSPAVGWRPKFWRRQLYNIREMRARNDAPVDTMGCSSLADIAADPKVYLRFVSH